MKKVEILVPSIYGYNNTQYVKGDIVDVDDALAAAFGDRCLILEEEKPKKRTRKVARDED